MTSSSRSTNHARQARRHIERAHMCIASIYMTRHDTQATVLISLSREEQTMEKKTYTLTIHHTGRDQYEVTVPEIGATKTAATLESALSITVHDIVKHLATRSLILVFVDPHTDLEQQAIAEITRLGISPQVKRKERHLLFEVPRPLTRAQTSWLDEHAGKLFERYYTKDELEVKLDALLKEARENRKIAPNE